MGGVAGMGTRTGRLWGRQGGGLGRGRQVSGFRGSFIRSRGEMCFAFLVSFALNLG
jgi:hypothetical protein